MRVTIKDIARETGLSVTTVSLVLNNKADHISDASRQLVLETARKLKYRPNQMAISLQKQRSHIIGLIIPDISNAFFSEIAREIDIELQRDDWNIILCCTDDNFDRDKKYLDMLYSRGVEGIIYIMSSSTSALSGADLEFYDSLPLPIVFADRYDPMINRSSVLLNYKKGSYLATMHLLELGHRRIACITGPSFLANSRERIEGYKMALEEVGVAFDQSLVFKGDYHYASGVTLAGDIIKATDASAIFAFNDMMANGAIHQIKQHGLKVPTDISVIGFDDITLSSMLETPLSTVRQPAKEIGQLAAQWLIQEIEGSDMNGASHHITLEPDLIIRASTAPPKTRRKGTNAGTKQSL